MVNSFKSSPIKLSTENNEAWYEQLLIQRQSILFQLQQHQRLVWHLNYNYKLNSLCHIKVHINGYSTPKLKSFRIWGKIKRVSVIWRNMDNVVKWSVNSLRWWNWKSSNLWCASICSNLMQIKNWVYWIIFQKF